MRYLKYLAAAIIFLVVGFLLGRTVVAPTFPPATSYQLPATSSLMIDFGTGELVTSAVTPVATATVFSLLQDLVKTKSLTLDFQDYPGMGVFVKQIGEQKNGGDKFWQYWVNNKQVQVAADKAAVKAGDIIEWKFIKSQPVL